MSTAVLENAVYRQNFVNNYINQRMYLSILTSQFLIRPNMIKSIAIYTTTHNPKIILTSTQAKISPLLNVIRVKGERYSVKCKYQQHWFYKI